MSLQPAPSFANFNVPSRVLLGPGPSELYPEVRLALQQHTIGYMDPAFVQMMEELKELLRYAFQTKNALTFPVSGPGSVGMETCFVNLVDEGDKVLVCRNGVFGGRMQENVERAGGIAVMLDFTWGSAINPEQVRAALKANPDCKILAFVHAETSTGVQSDAAELCRIATEFDCLTIMDAVTSLGGTPVYIDAWGVDAVYSGSQKCLSCTPGLSPVSFSDRAIAKVKARRNKVQSWFMDLNLVLAYWGETQRTYHHTAPGNSLYGLHAALLLLAREGLEASWQRHRLHHQALAAGLTELKLKLTNPETIALPQMNAVGIPDGIDDALLRKTLLLEHNVEIGAGLGALSGKIWRIGLMGYSARQENVQAVLKALAAGLAKQGHQVDATKALTMCNNIYGVS